MPAPLVRSALDRLLAALSLAVLWPVFAVIGLAIWLEDRGPVFYRQRRVGKNFAVFQFMKFRSMLIGADAQGLLTRPEDTRITKVGSILRKYKLDELPQLINVVRGEMALVGTRPEVEPFVELFRPQYEVLLQDRPGITDPATVLYRNEEKQFDAAEVEKQYVSHILPAKLRLSLAYQQRRNLASDLNVLAQTIVRLVA